jgi:hypothetical protein
MISVLTIFLVAVSSYFLGKFQPKKK